MGDGEIFQEVLKEVIRDLIHERGVSQATFAGLVWPFDRAPAQKLYRIFKKDQDVCIADFWKMCRVLNYSPESMMFEVHNRFKSIKKPNPTKLPA